jgi:hypothetical protein
MNLSEKYVASVFVLIGLGLLNINIIHGAFKVGRIRSNMAIYDRKNDKISFWAIFCLHAIMTLLSFGLSIFFFLEFLKV